MINTNYKIFSYYIFLSDCKVIIEVVIYRQYIIKISCFKDNNLIYEDLNKYKYKKKFNTIYYLNGEIGIKSLIVKCFINLKFKYNKILSIYNSDFKSYGNVYGLIDNNKISAKYICLNKKSKYFKKDYYNILGFYELFDGCFYIKIDNFNFNKASIEFINIYHNKIIKTIGKSRLKYKKNNIIFKLSDYKNSVKISLYKENNDFFILQNKDKIKNYISLNSYIKISVEDDNLTKNFDVFCKNIIVNSQLYIEDKIK